MTDITPEKVAAALCEDASGWRHSLVATLSVTASRDVLSVDVVRFDGPKDSETVRHFRAVVTPGETAPIVLERPDLADGRTVYGRSLGDTDHSEPPDGWHTFATDHVIYGGTGHISFAEARRFAAALVAVADAAEAAQAEQERAR